jgi:DNA-binding CsgD family transcriptional regulator
MEMGSKHFPGDALKALFAIFSLTGREKQIFLSILSGQGDKEIGIQLGISKRTVDKHRQHINYKLGTRTPLELLQAGLRFGLIKVPE